MTTTAHTNLPPGSHGLPLLGETLTFLIDPKFIVRRKERYGNVFRTHLLGQPTVVVIGPEAARSVLSSSMDAFSWGQGWPDTFQTLLGESLFVQDGPEHAKNRRLIMPAFHGRALAGYFDTMNRTMLRYLQAWEQQREFAWFIENKKLTFDIASQLLMGSKSGDDVARLSQLFSDLTNGFFVLRRSRQRWTRFGRALAARDALLKHIAAVIQQRRENPTNDALSLLLQARDEDGNQLTEREIMVQSLLLLFAGHETSTSMITSLCLELARHPQVLARARAEQQALAAEGELSLDQLGRMPYLEQILREIERLHPPVAGGFRGVTRPVEIEGYTIPAGTRVIYSILGTHTAAHIYPEPERFDPDRFAPGREEHKQQAFSLIGFGGGPRICVGMAFAQMEMKMLAAHLLRTYQWDILPGQDTTMALVPTRRPKDNLRVYFRYWHSKSLELTND